MAAPGPALAADPPPPPPPPPPGAAFVGGGALSSVMDAVLTAAVKAEGLAPTYAATALTKESKTPGGELWIAAAALVTSWSFAATVVASGLVPMSRPRATLKVVAACSARLRPRASAAAPCRRRVDVLTVGTSTSVLTPSVTESTLTLASGTNVAFANSWRSGCVQFGVARSATETFVPAATFSEKEAWM